MPRLNGNSSHGSKPITSLSRTFSWTPHCWPQKQQCVFTSRSGSTLVDSRTPVIADRCGPNRSMIRRGSTGISATFGYLCLSFVTWPAEALGRRRPGVQIPLPQRPLRQTEHRAPALGADVLIVPAARQLVAKAEFLL